MPSHQSTLTLAHRLGDLVVREERMLDAVLRRVGDASLVLLGEATHGTHEFYALRTALTLRLIREKGFDSVAVEADWPDAARVNRHVRGEGPANEPELALSEFIRFPRWMWRNHDVLELVSALRRHNDALPRERHVGFYGMDLYSLHRSMEAVVRYLDRVDPDAAARARERYACFHPFGHEPQDYARATFLGLSEDCEHQVLAELREMQHRVLDGDALLDAVQNARVAARAEQYYRTVFHGGRQSWNLRDLHMADTLDALVLHRRVRGGTGKLVVWAHNSHLGDARATEMGEDGEWNVGQLMRLRHGEDVVNVGFTTHHGTVSAADAWDGEVQRRRVRPALPGSIEDAFHLCGVDRFALVLQGEAAAALQTQRLERAIGVVYVPRTERQSHYFLARLARQFDVVIHVDESRAVEPLETRGMWVEDELPETFPQGM